MKVIMNDDRESKRQQALGRALQQIEKAYGKGAIMRLDQMDADVEGVSTGALSLDAADGGDQRPVVAAVSLGPEAELMQRGGKEKPHCFGMPDRREFGADKWKRSYLR